MTKTKTRNLKNSVIAITGAGSGIGRALALHCAHKGAKLALSDVNEASVLETKSLCRGVPADHIHTSVLDVRDQAAVEAWAADITTHFGEVNVIINNAGVALNVSFENMAYEDLRWLMDINYWGVVHGCMAFLPRLKQAKWGHIVNVSSLFGLIGVPNQTAYNSAKFAVRGLSESLRMELEMSHYDIGVSCVHPGGIKTNIANSARLGKTVGTPMSDQEFKDRFNKIAQTSPKSAAEIIVRAIETNNKRVLVGLDAKIGDAVQRVAPTFYQKLLKYVI